MPAGRDRIPNPGAEFALIIETANTTGWGPLEKLLVSTPAHVVLAQETHDVGPRVEYASARALALGWKSLWAPAVATSPDPAEEPSPGHSLGLAASSGGVAIFVRVHFGLRRPAIPAGLGFFDASLAVLEAGRALLAVADLPGTHGLVLACVYLHIGEGMSSRNAGILERLGVAVVALASPTVIGGDFNFEPAVLECSGFIEQLDGVLVVPESYTCSSGSTSKLDYFVVGRHLSFAVDSCAVNWDAATKPHLPVDLTFQASLVDLSVVEFRRHQRLGPGVPFGPRNEDYD